MDKLKKMLFWGHFEAALIKQHKKNIDKYNQKMTLGIITIISIILFAAIVTSPFTASCLNRVISRVSICSGALVIYLLLYFTCKKGLFDRFLSVAFYLSMIFAAILSIALSVITSPDQRATVVLGIFFIVPLAHIDYFKRKLGFSILVLLSHSLLSLYFKGISLTVVDALNSVCFICIGSFIGHIVQKTKLTSFELEKKLIFERETDILTGLKNRRKMIELFTSIEKNHKPLPTCAILLDIDHFKDYNDLHGHTVGDNFLRVFGQTLLNFEHQYNIKFYRYGGEEFAAFMWDYSADQQKAILEIIRVGVENIDIKYGRTISIGYIDCTNQKYSNPENALAFADIALYKAKHSGRNQVVAYDPSLEKE